MKISFDIRGNLQPYATIELEWNEFWQEFVDKFDSDSSRFVIFEQLSQYLNDFIDLTQTDFVLWIDGSFTTTKLNPADVDFVILLDSSVHEENSKILEEKFLGQSLTNSLLDCYIVKVYPQNHPKHVITELDKLYWQNWFGRTRTNRQNRHFPKGFIELKIAYKLWKSK